jgi:hypothetical protein
MAVLYFATRQADSTISIIAEHGLKQIHLCDSSFLFFFFLSSAPTVWTNRETKSHLKKPGRSLGKKAGEGARERKKAE